MANKLKLTKDEYLSFMTMYNNKNYDAFSILDEINRNYYSEYPELYDYLFENATPELNRKVQIDFIKDPLSYVEVEKKKYYVHLFKLQEDGYLNQDKNGSRWFINNTDEMEDIKTQFTKDEIQNLKDLGFKINDDALEEVENGK